MAVAVIEGIGGVFAAVRSIPFKFGTAGRAAVEDVRQRLGILDQRNRARIGLAAILLLIIGCVDQVMIADNPS